MRPPESAAELYAMTLDWNPDDEAHAAEIGRRAERDNEQSFRAFALRFRRDVGRPMTDMEWALANLAHSVGFQAGAESMGELLASDPPAPAATEEGDDGRR